MTPFNRYENENSIGAVIQARIGSVRSPGKVLHSFAGFTIIEHIVKRIQLIKEFSLVALAIPSSEKEELLAKAGSQAGAIIGRGSEEDVLSRYILAGEQLGVPYLARICGDCPWVDLTLARELAQCALAGKADYIVTTDPIPLGTGLEIISLSALKRIDKLASEPRYREHVTTYIHDHPDQFERSFISAPEYLRNNNCRLTVDTEDDLRFQDSLMASLNTQEAHTIELPEILTHLKSHPELLHINAHVLQKDWRISPE